MRQVNAKPPVKILCTLFRPLGGDCKTSYWNYVSHQLHVCAPWILCVGCRFLSPPSATLPIILQPCGRCAVWAAVGRSAASSASHTAEMARSCVSNRFVVRLISSRSVNFSGFLWRSASSRITKEIRNLDISTMLTRRWSELVTCTHTHSEPFLGHEGFI